MSRDDCREAAKQLIETMPALIQPVASEMRRGDHPMPMPHFRTLMILAHGCCTMTDLAEKQHVSAPTMSNTISVLVDHGWVERVVDERDRRRAELSLTADGRAAVRGMQTQVEELLAERLSALSSAEIETLRAGLDVLVRAFGTHSHVPEGGEAA